MQRIVFTGGPKTGKSSLAEAASARFGGPILHTDALIGKLAWGEDSAEVARWFDEQNPPWIIEGVTAVRALRKWLAHHPDRSERPADVVVWCGEPKIERFAGAKAMAAGIEKIWNVVALELTARGVPIEQG